MFKIQCLVYLLGYFVLGSNAGPASLITPCKADDSKCLLSSAQATIKLFAAGIPELGIASADHLHIDHMNADANNLKLSFSDATIVGPTHGELVELTRDVAAQTIKFVLSCPLTVTGQYNLNGKILFLEATGKGPFEIKSDKIVFTITLKTKTIEKAGKKYWRVTGFDYTYELVKKVTFKLDNLFGGDEEKAKIILNMMNENYKEVIEELGGPILKESIAKFIEPVNKLFLAIPTDELEIV